MTLSNLNPSIKINHWCITCLEYQYFGLLGYGMADGNVNFVHFDFYLECCHENQVFKFNIKLLILMFIISSNFGIV